MIGLTSCSDDDDGVTDGEIDGEGSGQKVEVTYKNLSGEWICYYQYKEESDYKEDAYYNTDNLTLTFNEDHTGYLKSEHTDELLEIGTSQRFTYNLDGAIIYSDVYDGEIWNIISLTETNLELKWQDEDYIIIAKFVKRVSLAGKVSKLTSSGAPSGDSYYSFSYDFKGELSGITCNNKSLTYEPRKDAEIYIKWYNGDRFLLTDKKEEGHAEVRFNNTPIANAIYDNNGYLVKLSDGNNQVNEFKYSNGNLSSATVNSSIKLDYEYSKEKNDANIDLNYFIDSSSASDGKTYSYANHLELGLSGEKSNNLISKIITPEEIYDFYFTYSYERYKR